MLKNILGFLSPLLVLFSCCKTERIIERPETELWNITTEDAVALIEKKKGNPNFLIIDVRTPPELSSGVIANSVNINYSDTNFQNEIAKLSKNNTYLVYCQTSRRSVGALNMMEAMGFTRVYNLCGGMNAWKAAGYPVK